MEICYTRFDGNDQEGLGSILQSQLHLYAYCRMNNKKFFFPGFKNISHYQYSQDTKEEFIDKINKFFSFPSEGSFGESYIEPQFLLKKWGEIYNDEKKEFIKELYGYIKYTGNSFFQESKTSLSVHIRNINPEDVCHDINREYLNTKKEKYFLDLITNVKKIHGNDLDIHVFSQGEEKDFLKFKEIHDCTLHLNDDVIKTFYHLLTSNILITSNSSFSWCAHLFNMNEHVYSRNNFFHSWYKTTHKTDINGQIII
jgi:hypothetical protein